MILSPPVKVKVVVRIRPLIQKEIDEGCSAAVEPVTENRLLAGSTPFSFSAVFGSDAQQSFVYDASVGDVLDHLFLGESFEKGLFCSYCYQKTIALRNLLGHC